MFSCKGKSDLAGPMRGRGLNALLATGMNELPVLTEAGTRIRRVVVVGLVGGACESDDWRGELPRHLLTFLPQAHGVLVHDYAGIWKCSKCDPHITGQSYAFKHAPEDCTKYIGKEGSRPAADLLLVIGSGHTNSCNKIVEQDKCTEELKNPDRSTHYVDLWKIFHSGLVSDRTLTLHVPIKQDSILQTPGDLFPFQHIIHDDSYLKPMARPMIRDMQHFCQEERKKNVLLYVGRYKEGKGQVGFLERVDPAELHGWTVRFFGNDYTNSLIRADMERVARERGISIVINPGVEKHELFREYCRASGQVHFASHDKVGLQRLPAALLVHPAFYSLALACCLMPCGNILACASAASPALNSVLAVAMQNPRTVYEGVYAGNPMFLSLESQLPGIMYAQDWVTSLSFYNATQAEFGAAFNRFMDQVRSNQLFQPLVLKFAGSELKPHTIYHRICIEVGICAATNKDRRPYFDML